MQVQPSALNQRDIGPEMKIGELLIKPEMTEFFHLIFNCLDFRELNYFGTTCKTLWHQSNNLSVWKRTCKKLEPNCQFSTKEEVIKFVTDIKRIFKINLGSAFPISPIDNHISPCIFEYVKGLFNEVQNHLKNGRAEDFKAVDDFRKASDALTFCKSIKISAIPDKLPNTLTLKTIDQWVTAAAEIKTFCVTNQAIFSEQSLLIDLGWEKISTLPNEIQIFNIAELNLRGNVLNTLEPIFKLTNLVKLNLNSNALKEVPKDIQNLSKLEELDLSFNAIKTCSSEIKELKQLRDVNLLDNPLKFSEKLSLFMLLFTHPVPLTITL